MEAYDEGSAMEELVGLTELVAEYKTEPRSLGFMLLSCLTRTFARWLVIRCR